MATLPRPGVEISQEIITTSPTILTPSLVPCLVGPCFQIVKPLTDDGSLNAEAQATVAALLSSNSSLGDELNLSGRSMVLNVNGNGDQTIQFPVTKDNAALSRNLVQNTINKQLTGAVAEFIDDKLVIRTSATGPTASISVVEVQNNSAYGSGADDIVAMNYMVGKTISGKTTYNNSTYTIPYSSFPSPKTDVSEIVLSADAIDVFMYYDKRATQLSEDSAIAVNSYHCGETSWGGSTVSLAHQPALSAGAVGGRVSLWARPTSGSKTNTLVHPGTEASLTLPLCHDVAPNGTPTATWPDVTGGNSLEINCIGKSLYMSTGLAEDAGSIDGADGNDVQVVIQNNLNGDFCTASYAAGTLTISGSTTTKFSTLATAIDSASLATSISGVLEVSMTQAADDDAVCDFSQFAGTYNLGGGSDPVDFSLADPGQDSDGLDLEKAYICGATSCAATLAETLGIAGETLSISVDGEDAVVVTLSAGATVVTSINDAMGYACASAATANNALGETITNLLRLETESADGADSTIEISASSDSVIKLLFGGEISSTESVQAADVMENDRQFIITGGTEYNAGSSSQMMKAIQPSSVSMEVSGLTALAGIVLDAVTLADTGNENLVLTIDGQDSTVAIATGSCDTLDNTISTLNSVFTNNGVALKASKLDSDSKILLFSNGAPGTVISMKDTTAAALQAVWDVAGVDATAATVTATVADSGNGGKLEITSVSNSLTNLAMSTATAATLTASTWALSDTESLIEYSSGNITITFNKDSEAVGQDPATLQVTNASAVPALTYSRVWPNNTQPHVPVYTGRVFQGMSGSLAISDSLFNEGSMLGRIVGIETFGVGASTYTGAQLVISEYASDNKSMLEGWYAKAENLVDGDGRVSAEVVMSDLEQTVAIKHALLRNTSGLPMSNDAAPIYLGYNALRKDVSADTYNPQLLEFASIAEVDTFIGPIDPTNPLAFGMYMAFLNSTNITISALGVNETTADAPFGTLEAYAQALDFLEMKEVYALAPMTPDLSVFQKFSQHVTDMSEAAAKKERMAICCPALPTEESPTLVESGSMTIEDIGGGKYNVSLNIQSEIDQKTLHLAINGNADANGDTINAADGGSYTPSQGIYLDREGDANYYLIVGTPGPSTVTIDTGDIFNPGESGPGTGGNGDSFYTSGSDAVSALSDWEVDGEQCTIFIRQPALDTKTTGGRAKICEGLAEIAGGVTGFQNRRLVLVQPEQVGVDFGGMEISVDGHYLCGAIAAMIGQQPASQPFTNLPMVGFTRAIGSNDKFSDKHMSTAAAGGVYWVIQDVPGGALASRHQLTTDVTSLKTRELSILKSVDFVSKLIRNQIKRYIGRKNITKQLLETVALGIGSALNRVSGSVVAKATLDKVAQDPAKPDSISVDVSITPYYPANKIKVTIYV